MTGADNNMEEIKERANGTGIDMAMEEIPYWSALPELELYMDQVIILLNRYFSIIGGKSGESETVTKNMINNYVKMKVVPPPVKKKYSRTHIAYLVLVCLMKQVFSISMIKSVLPEFEDEERIREMYNSFVKYFRNAADEAIEKYSTAEYDNTDEAVIRLSAESIVLKILAEKLI